MHKHEPNSARMRMAALATVAPVVLALLAQPVAAQNAATDAARVPVADIKPIDGFDVLSGHGACPWVAAVAPGADGEPMWGYVSFDDGASTWCLSGEIGDINGAMKQLNDDVAAGKFQIEYDPGMKHMIFAKTSSE